MGKVYPNGMKKIILNMVPSDVDELKKTAEERGVSVSKLIRRALVHYYLHLKELDKRDGG